SDIKLKANVSMVSNEKCQEALDTVDINSNTICAEGVDGQDACIGDTGGPLMREFIDEVQNHFQWYQHGIASQGVDCGRVGYPAVYTKVQKYIYWIVEHTKSK
ncbi:hypothetical protein ILUMI_17174, partial [Ignelater luminosus]